MDDELEELESILSDHFGRTPINTPICSQTSGQEDQEDENVEETDDDFSQVVEGRVRVFVSQANDTGRNESDSDSDDDADEFEGIQSVNKFMKEGCGCQRQCHKKLIKEQVVDHILLVQELTKDEKDISIMSVLSSSAGDVTKKGTKRQRTKNTFHVEGREVCKKTFMVYYDIGKHCLSALIKHVQTHGVTVRVHGNKGRSPKHAIKYEDVLRVVHFIQNYADENGIPQPAAPRVIDNIPCTFLPSKTTKVDMHKEYRQSSAQERVLSLTSFKDIWRTCLPHIRIGKPREDVCATCEKHRQTIVGAVTEDEKLESLRAMETHVNLAKREREFYMDCVRRSQQTRESEEKFVHITFDFSQNVNLPHYARQPGPLYFLTLRKVQIFGVRIDGFATATELPDR